MWSKCTEDEWIEYTTLLNRGIFFNIDYLKTTAKSYSVNLNLLIYRKKDSVLGLCGYYSLNKRAITPEWFSDTAIYVDTSVGEVVYFDIYNSLINLLKKNYNYIRFKLPAEISDIRSFKWRNFDIEVRYTHIKDDFSTLHYKKRKNLRKINQDNYNVVVSEFSEKGLEKILKLQKKIGVTKDTRDKYRILFSSLSEKLFTKFFDVYDSVSGKLICSRIVLIDNVTKKMYFLMVSDTQSTDKYMHTYLHFISINWAKENGIEQIDFCGANIKSISIFKSFFGTELQSYYLVSHIHWIYKIAVYIKRTLRNALRMINL